MDYFQRLFKPNILFIFLLGICQGFPWVIIGSAMTGWLTDAGLTRTAIGVFGSITFAYAINFLWAPLLDRFSIPVLARFGQRKSWIIFLLALIAMACWALSFQSPQTSFWQLSGIALLVAASSATMDVAIDAYRVEHADGDDVPVAAAMAVSGWWTGYSLLGWAAFKLKGETLMDWADIFRYMTGFCIAMIFVVAVLVREKNNRRQQVYQGDEKALKSSPIWGRIHSTMVLPFKDLITNHGLLFVCLLLGFLFTFKMGEAFLGRMSITFYKEVGYTDSQIADYSKMLTWGVTIAFSILGAFINIRLGVFKGLLIGGITMAATNLLFALIAAQGPYESLFILAIVLDGFTSAFATVVLVSFVTHLTSKTFSASQYALLASVANFGRTTLSSGSGWMVDTMDGNWVLFFIITSLMVIPSLCLLVWLRHLMKRKEL